MKRQKQVQFKVGVCPITSVDKFWEDARAFYFSVLTKSHYQGPFNPMAGSWPWRSHSDLKLQFDVLELSGLRYRAMPRPVVNWCQADDDTKVNDLTPGSESARHFHADFVLNRRRVHIDFIKFLKHGPLRGVTEFLVFADGRFITRGGTWGIVPAFGSVHWPVVAPIGRDLITIQGWQRLTATELKVFGLKFWSLE